MWSQSFIHQYHILSHSLLPLVIIVIHVDHLKSIMLQNLIPDLFFTHHSATAEHILHTLYLNIQQLICSRFMQAEI